MKVSRFFSTFILLFILTGCAAAVVPMSPIDQDLKAKDFSVLNSRASVYIYRTESMHDEEPYMVLINNKLIGLTSAKTFFRLNLVPGKYDIMSKSGMHSSLFQLDVVAGKNYYLWQDIYSNGFYHLTSLQLVSDAEGRAGVLDANLAASGLTDDLSPK